MEAFCETSMTKLSGDISAQSRMLINNVFLFFNEIKNDPEKLIKTDYSRVRNLTALVCGVSVRTVDNIKKEITTSGVAFSPREKKCSKSPVTEVDDFDKEVIRRVVASFYEKGEYPTIRKVLEAVKEKIPNLKCGWNSMRSVLMNMGYKYKRTVDGRKYLMERRDIVCARMEFLRKIKTLRESMDKRPRFYLDETWVNKNHTRNNMWLDENDTGGFKTPVGKGQRLIVCHAGSEKTGFIPEAKWVFKANKSKDADYHTEMNAERYTDWFLDFLHILEEPSVIIIDNASYHSKQSEFVPNNSTKKCEIQNWLRKKNIPFSEQDIREELLKKVKDSKPPKVYMLDQLANERGHEVIRLPPYHCQYNPIELIWAQVKGFVAAKNSTFKMADVEKLLHDGINSVTQEDWRKCVAHAERLQEKDYSTALLRDTQPLIIYLNDESSDSEDEF